MSYQSWSVVFGEQPSAAKWNILGTNDASFNDGTGIASLATNVTAISNPYKFSVYRNAAWTTSGSVYGKVQHDTELYDTNSNFDNATNYRYTAPVAGFYFVSVGCKSNSASGALVANAVFKNGSNILTSEMENGANTTMIGPNVTGILQLAANDYIEHYHYGSGSTGGTGSNYTFFHGMLLSRT